jgi:hypothetical protein
MTNSYLAVEYWFSHSNKNYGFPEFLALRDLKDTSKGYLVVMVFVH